MFIRYAYQTCYRYGVGGTYNKGELLLVKFSFRPVSPKTSQFCDVTLYREGFSLIQNHAGSR